MTRVNAAATAAAESEADLTVREQEILAVCATLLTEIGYERLTIDAVAARARASKATIYRRWPGKPALVGAAMRYITDQDNLAPDYTGNLRTDLLTLLTNARERFADKAPLLAGMVNAMQSDPELAGYLRADIARCRAATDALLARYVDEGVITASDPEFIRELAPATIMTRILITGEPVDDCLLHNLVDRVLMPLLSSAKGWEIT